MQKIGNLCPKTNTIIDKMAKKEKFDNKSKQVIVEQMKNKTNHGKRKSVFYYVKFEKGLHREGIHSKAKGFRKLTRHCFMNII